MVSIWLAIGAVLLMALAWYLTWNAAWVTGHLWEHDARRAVSLAEEWRARAERAEALLAKADKQIEESTRLVLQANERLRRANIDG